MKARIGFIGNSSSSSYLIYAHGEFAPKVAEVLGTTLKDGRDYVAALWGCDPDVDWVQEELAEDEWAQKKIIDVEAAIANGVRVIYYEFEYGEGEGAIELLRKVFEYKVESLR